MPKSIQEYIASVTEKSGKDLIAAAQEIPESCREWSPLGKGRTVIDQLAECAVINLYCSLVIRSREWPANALDKFADDKAAVAKDWNTAIAALGDNAAKLAAAIRKMSDDDLDLLLQTAFGPMTLAEIASIANWNMGYHQGQVTYVGILNETSQ